MIAVSYLKSKLNKIDTIKGIEESDADLIHVDLIDGIYCGENNFSIDEVINVLKDTIKELDVHLMVKNPLKYIDKLSILKPINITFHLNTDNPLEVIKKIHEYNINAGIAINPDEDISLINEYIDSIDYCLIMGVAPGTGGQKFNPQVIDKIEYLQDKFISIGIDGGINDETIKYLKELRINIIVSGSFVCMSDDYNKQISILNK